MNDTQFPYIDEDDGDMIEDLPDLIFGLAMCEHCDEILTVVDAIHVRCDNEACENYEVMELIINF